MQLAIVSDSHDNIVNLTKALKFINKEKIKTLIHCGDLCSPSVLTEVLVPNFKGQMHLVYGNVGDPELLEEVARKYKNVKIHGYVGKITVPGHPEFISGSRSHEIPKQVRNDKIKIAFTHFPDEGKKLAESGKYDLVFYGHTHKPWIEEIKTNQANEAKKLTKLINPGTIGGMFYKATFAVYDTKTNKLELTILEAI